MSGIVTGFEYDIFISYRQKDNKYDGWVTEFVDNLNRELEATFKEEITVYFDSNAHDGLLETHDVGDSLKNKLRCLVFIPIISRTYCDPKSFAWEHEFKSFIDMASGDRFGQKIRLPNGNVASRVLPVRIHDLDDADIKLCESATGSVLRGVEFIYKSAGVNRPLRMREDNPHDNLNHTIYRDQINKVALSVKGIIEGIIIASAPGHEEEAEKPEQKPTPVVRKRSAAERVVSILAKPKFIIPVLLVLFGLLFTFSGSTDIPFDNRDWIVITDFENTTGDPVFDKSLYTAFSITTGQSRYINILPRQRMMEALSRMELSKDTFIDDKTGREIAARENVDIYIVPGISEAGGTYVVTAKVQDTKTGDLLKSEVLYAEDMNEILLKIDDLSRKIRRGLGESRYRISQQDKPLTQVTTSSLEALKLFSLGIEKHYKLDFKAAREYYESALRADTGFTAAKASLGNILIEKFDSEAGKELLRQAVRSVDNLTDKEKYGILGFYEIHVEKNLPKGIEYTKRLTDLYPDDPAYRNNLGYYYQMSKQYEEAATEYKAALAINPNQAITYGGLLWLYLTNIGNIDSAMVWAEKMISDNPQNPWAYAYLGSAWVCLDSLDKAETAFEKGRETGPGLTFNLFRLSYTYRLQGKYKEAIEAIEGIPVINQSETLTTWYNLGVNHQLLGNKGEADKYFSMYRTYATDDWLKNWPDNPDTYISLGAVAARMGDMEYSEQMLRKAVEIDSANYLRIAGLLCIQGKVPEALEQIEKALETGYRDLPWLKMNTDLYSLQYDVRFRKLLDEYF
jgi:tetratricopeptide (TPR) repeat protein